MLIVALVLAVIGLAALVTAVVTSNELVAWVCIAASVIGVILLIVDAIRERQHRRLDEAEAAAPTADEDQVESSATAETTAYSETDESVDATYSTFDADYPEDDAPAETPDAAEPEPEGETEPKTEAEGEPEEQKPGDSASR